MWENFRDLFRSIVHYNDPALSKDKLHYLRVYVSGKALEIVKIYLLLLPIILLLGTVSRTITKTIDAIFTHIDALKDFGRPTDQSSDLIVFFTTSRSEDNTQLIEWQKSRKIFLGFCPTYRRFHVHRSFLNLVQD